MWLSILSIRFTVFLNSVGFRGFSLFLAFMLEMCTTSFGISPNLIGRMRLFVDEGILSSSDSVALAVAFSGIFSLLVISAIYIASSAKIWAMAVPITIFSIIMSFKGLAGDYYHGVTNISQFDFNMILSTIFFSVFASLPSLYVMLNSNLTAQEFGGHINAIQTTENDQIKDHLIKVVQNKLKVRNENAEAETAKAIASAKKKNNKAQKELEALNKIKESQEKSNIQVGANFDPQELMNKYSKN